MKLYVPDIGDRLKLTEDWSFELYYEYRNETMFASLGKEYNRSDWYSGRDKKPIDVKLPKGAILKVDRIYIRKGSGYENYSSITFRFECDGYKKARFWAKLKDCNNIQFELESLAKRLEEIKLPAASTLERPKNIKLSDLMDNDLAILKQKMNQEVLTRTVDLKDMSKNKFPKKLRLEIYEIVKKIEDISTKGSLLRKGERKHSIDISYRFKLSDPDKNDLLCEVGSAASVLKNAKTYLTILRDDPANIKKENFKDLFEL